MTGGFLCVLEVIVFKSWFIACEFLDGFHLSQHFTWVLSPLVILCGPLRLSRLMKGLELRGIVLLAPVNLIGSLWWEQITQVMFRSCILIFEKCSQSAARSPAALR